MWIICLLGLGVLVASCEADNPKPTNVRYDIPLTEGQKEIVERGNDFALRLFKEFNALEWGRSFCISPLSISALLTALANGADGETYRQITGALLGRNDYDIKELNDCYAALVPALLSVDRATKITMANALFLNKGFKPYDSFLNSLNDYYDAEVRTLDFYDPKTLDIINDWCASHTGNLIPAILKEVDPLAVLYMMNALYFKSQWVKRFETKNTFVGNFTTFAGDEQEVEYMDRVADFPLYADDAVRTAAFDYGNKAFSMIVILPEQGVSIDEVAKDLNAERWKQYTSYGQSREIRVRFPKFTKEYDSNYSADNLKKALLNMGMTLPFSDLADFGKLSDKELCISLIKQNTFIKVDEEGTEAAAVTVVDMKETSLPPSEDFFMNRPFIYAIREISTGAILFIGQVTDF